MTIKNTLATYDYKFNTRKDKLWVFETTKFLEIYAPTLKEAMVEVRMVEAESGLEFSQHHNWKDYQTFNVLDEHIEEIEKEGLRTVFLKSLKEEIKNDTDN